MNKLNALASKDESASEPTSSDHNAPMRVEMVRTTSLKIDPESARIRHAERFGTRKPWLIKLLSRRHPRIAAIALANKIGRIAWALMSSGERYREPAVA